MASTSSTGTSILDTQSPLSCSEHTFKDKNIHSDQQSDGEYPLGVGHWEDGGRDIFTLTDLLMEADRWREDLVRENMEESEGKKRRVGRGRTDETNKT